MLISGALAGLGGLVYVVPTSTNFNATVSGYGFLALAVLIFGQREAAAHLHRRLLLRPDEGHRLLLFRRSLSWRNLGIPSDIYKMIPFIATMVVLAFSLQEVPGAPASGVPYDKGAR